jgi:hypothetical protein
MQTIKLKHRASDNGTLTISVPDELRDRDLEVLVVLQPVDRVAEASQARNDQEWPVAFFEETYGSLAADPTERLPQGEIEQREAIR